MKTRYIALPEWAQKIRLVCNGIDGWPNLRDQEFKVEDFIRQWPTLEKVGGQGEWDVLVYAVSDWTNNEREFHIYGRDNPYRHLRGTKGTKVKKVGTWSYMGWARLRFRMAQTVS